MTCLYSSRARFSRRTGAYFTFDVTAPAKGTYTTRYWNVGGTVFGSTIPGTPFKILFAGMCERARVAYVRVACASVYVLHVYISACLCQLPHSLPRLRDFFHHTFFSNATHALSLLPCSYMMITMYSLVHIPSASVLAGVPTPDTTFLCLPTYVRYSEYVVCRVNASDADGPTLALPSDFTGMCVL